MRFSDITDIVTPYEYVHKIENDKHQIIWERKWNVSYAGLEGKATNNPSNPSTCTYGQTVTPLAPTPYTGYIFNCWSPAQQTCVGYDISFIADFSETQRYTVTFDGNGGTVDGEQTKQITCESGSNVYNPDSCTREGYSFTGWYTMQQEGHGTIVHFPQTITSDVTYYAHWEITPGTVLLDINGTNGTQSGSISLGSGYYRLTMSGGGGTPGYFYVNHWSCCSYERHLYSGGGGAAFYGIINISSSDTIQYSCGSTNNPSSFGGLICGAGGNQNLYYGGSITLPPSGGSLHVVEYGVSSNGNNGRHAINQNIGYTLYGGSSKLVYDGSSANLPSISLEYGRGTTSWYGDGDALTDVEPRATAGCLKLEKVTYVTS